MARSVQVPRLSLAGTLAAALLLPSCASAPRGEEEIGRYLQTRDPQTQAVVSQVAFPSQDVCIAALMRMSTIPSLRPFAYYIGCSPLSASTGLAIRAALYDPGFQAQIVIETSTRDLCATLTEGLMQQSRQRSIRLTAACAAK